MMRRGLILLLALGGCGYPRLSTGDELQDAVLMRVDPLGDCVAVNDDPPMIFKDTGGPSEPPGLLTQDSFEQPEVRAAAAAIAISYPDYARKIEQQPQGGTPHEDGCTMDISVPAYSGSFAFVDYSSPNGAIGVYVFRKDSTGWRVAEHKVMGAW